MASPASIIYMTNHSEQQKKNAILLSTTDDGDGKMMIQAIVPFGGSAPLVPNADKSILYVQCDN
jgi:hypothetical protein